MLRLVWKARSRPRRQSPRASKGGALRFSPFTGRLVPIARGVSKSRRVAWAPDGGCASGALPISRVGGADLCCAIQTRIRTSIQSLPLFEFPYAALKFVALLLLADPVCVLLNPPLVLRVQAVSAGAIRLLLRLPLLLLLCLRPRNSRQKRDHDGYQCTVHLSPSLSHGHRAARDVGNSLIPSSASPLASPCVN